MTKTGALDPQAAHLAGLATWAARHRHGLSTALAAALALVCAMPWECVTAPGIYSDLVQRAILEGWSLGDRIVATYGPFAFLAFRLADDTLYGPRLLLSAVIIVFVVCRAAALAEPAMRSALVPVWIIAMFLPLSVVGWLEYAPLLHVAYLPLILLPVDLTRAHRRFPWAACLSRGAIAASICLMKISYVPLVLAILMLMVVVGAVRKDLRHAGLVCLAWLGSLLVGWVGTGQPLRAIPAAIANGGEVIGGFQEGMSLWRGVSAVTWPAFLATQILVGAALSVALAMHRDLHAAAVVAAFGLVGGHLARAGYVRADVEHLQYALLAALSVVLVLLPDFIHRIRAVRAPRAWRLVAALLFGLGLANAVLAARGLLVANGHTLVARVVALDTLLRSGRPHVVSRTSDVEPTLAKAVAGRTIDAVREADGALMQYGSAAPRPTITGYAAYTTALAQANRAFLEGPSGPELVVLGDLDPGEWMHPTIRDNLSFLSLLTHYRHEATFGSRHLYARRAVPLTFTRHALGTHALAAGPVPVPQRSFVWCAVRLDEPLPRSLLRLQPAVLVAILESDAGVVVKRLVPEMAAQGFLIRPALGDTASFQRLDASAPPAAAPASDERLSIRAHPLVVETGAGLEAERMLPISGSITFEELVFRESPEAQP